MTSVLFISLISRDDQPLYIQGFEQIIRKDEPSINHEIPELQRQNSGSDPKNIQIHPEDANKFLKYNFLSHMALDVFASPMSLHLREQQGDSDGILLLFIQDDVTVYGMETNNGLKLVLGMSGEVSTRPQLKTLFLKVHKAYLKTVCNPFTDVLRTGDHDKMLHTTAFDARIKTLVMEWEN